MSTSIVSRAEPKRIGRPPLPADQRRVRSDVRLLPPTLEYLRAIKISGSWGTASLGRSTDLVVAKLIELGITPSDINPDESMD